MQKIIPFLWFDSEAKEAVNFYVSIFSNSKVVDTTHYNEDSSRASGRPEGSVMSVMFELEGQAFGALNGGPLFSFTPASSFFIFCSTNEEIDRIWGILSTGGKVFMELGTYPFSERYGWVQDVYGISWQMGLGERAQKIIPSLLFSGPVQGKAEEAVNFYTSLFADSKMLELSRYEDGEEGTIGTLKYSMFTLRGQEFIAMDSGIAQPFTFSPALSYMVKCSTQMEIDTLWNALSAVKEAEQCGWLQDKFGVSWQIVPDVLEK